MISVRLPDELERRLDLLAEATNRTKSFYIRQALERSLEDMEDAFLAESAYERFKASGKKTVPLETVMKEYGMEN